MPSTLMLTQNKVPNTRPPPTADDPKVEKREMAAAAKDDAKDLEDKM